MHAIGHMAKLAVSLDVVEEIHAEVIQTKVGDGDASLDVLHLDHLILQTAQLLLAIGHVIGLGVENVVVAGRSDVRDHHAVFHSLLEVDVFVQADVRPVVDELDAGVL